MLAVQDLAKVYGKQTLFSGASFVIGPQARIGVIGPNGAGKSTFFRILSGDESSDGGKINRPKQFRLGLLKQEWAPRREDSILEATLHGHQLWYNARAEMQRIEHELADNASEATLEAYHDAEHEFAVLGGHAVEARAEEYLTGLGFKSAQFKSPCQALSGGWRMRVHLAGILLQEPDLLLLDEPTNHLDLTSVIWFEDFLTHYPHAILLISHDRRLIERFATEILEFAPPSLSLWPGGLKQFEREKVARTETLENEITNREREVEHLNEFIDRFKAKASKARQAQSRMKTAANYQEEIEALRAKMPTVSRRPSRFKITPQGRLPRIIMELEKVVVGYKPETPLFDLDRCVIESGKKIGVIGVNGVGKSTFLKLCAGELAPLQGRFRRNEEVTMGYFAQHRMEELPLMIKGLDYLSEKSRDVSPSELRGVAASLGLNANDLDKNIQVLSGGEKARLSLSRILLSRPGFLLLDEPTNHLDMEACDALVKGLKDYAGTVLVVSHNRHLLDSLVEVVLEISPGKAEWHLGDYSEWLAKRAEQAVMPSVSTRKSGESDKERRRQEAQARQQKADSQKKAKSEAAKAEAEVVRLQELCKAIDQFLCDPQAPKSPDFAAKLKERSRLSEALETAEQQWLKLLEALS